MQRILHTMLRVGDMQRSITESIGSESNGTKLSLFCMRYVFGNAFNCAALQKINLYILRFK